MTGNEMEKHHNILLPLSWIYGAAVRLRNALFDAGILKSQSFATPIISVGNITVGGTGKTPHVEYLVRLLKDRLHVAVLSRGYKRKSHGFLLATPTSTVSDLGDEPYQIKQKFPDISVAVDKKRTRGIERLTKDKDSETTVDVILLDDAFQHRYVKPGLNILLTDYHRLIINDKLLPAGRLRESVKSKERANIVIVTKCPTTLTPMDFRVLTHQLGLFPYQRLYFTTLVYDPIHPLFLTEGKESQTLEGQNVLLLTGIAAPQQLVNDLRPQVGTLHPLCFGDHHQFRKKDIRLINQALEALPHPRLIVTTEKDGTRLADAEGLSSEARCSLYVLPVRVSFMQDGEQAFAEQITGYISKNSRKSILLRDKKDQKADDERQSDHQPVIISFKNNNSV